MFMFVQNTVTSVPDCRFVCGTREIPETTKSGASAELNVRSAEAAEFPAASTERTRKWYMVPGTRLVNRTEWLVTSETSRPEVDPYVFAKPNCTSEVAGSSVVQVTVADMVAGLTAMFV